MPSKNPEVLKRASKKHWEKIKDNEEVKRKARERARKWAEKNKERLKEYREKNKEKHKELRKRWIEENRDHVNKYNSEWQKNNLEYAKKRNLKYKQTDNGKIVRRASRDAYRKRCTDASLNKFDMKNVYNIYKKCKEMNKLTGQEHHVDHIIPIRHEKVCGLHVSWNLQIIPKKDNLSKNNYFEG